MLKAAVIGVGMMGKNHARIYADMERTDLVAIADPDEVLVKKLSKKYGCKGYIDYKDMLESEKLDVVSVAVPTELHKKVAFDLIEKGIPMLLEKPISGTVTDGQEIIDSAKKAGVKLMIGHIERFNPAILELKKRLDAGELGRVFKIDVNRVGPFPVRIRDVGVVVDLAVHDIDIIRYLTGSEVKRIRSEIDRRINSEHEDLLKALLRLENGTICDLNIDWLTPTKIRELYITGEKGMFKVNYITQDIYFYENSIIDSSKSSYTDVVKGVLEGKMTRFFIPKKEPLLAEIEHFVDCVENDLDPLVSGEDGLKALALAREIIDSAED